MALQSGGGQNDLYFSAELQDNVTPTADQIEKRLKDLGASKSEIKMFLTAYDQATPQIKAAQEQLKKLPKEHMINVKTNAGVARKAFDDLKRAVAAPITVTMHVKDDFDNYVNNLKARAMTIETRLKHALSNTPMFAGLMGATGNAYNFVAGPLSTMTGLPFSSLGVGAAGLGAGGAIGAFMAKSFEANANLEQQMAQLTQVMRTPSSAQAAYQQVTKTAQTTPFNQPDVLASYIQMAQMGTNPTNRAYGIKASANLAAGAQVPISQATGALQNASLGYFESFNNLTGRNIRQTDFTYGGRYSGQTYQQAVLAVLKQYQGASQTQMQTFKGLMTNIQDVITQKVLIPGGQPVFGALKGMEQKTANALQSPHFQLQLSQEVDKLQTGLYKVFELVKQGKNYFVSSLEDPLKQITHNMVQFGAAFGKAFGGTALTAVKYLSEAFTTILTPVTKLVAAIPQIGQLAGLMKALHMMGISTSTGAANFFGGIAHFNPAQALHGIAQFTSLLGKIGVYFTAKTILDMKNANTQLNSSFKELGSQGKDALDGLKIGFDKLIFKAAAFGATVAQLKDWGAGVASTIGPSVGTNKLSQSAYFGSQAVMRLSSATGTDMGPAFDAWLNMVGATSKIRSGKISPHNLMDQTANQLHQSDEYLSKTLGVDLKTAAGDAVIALHMFSKALISSSMYNPRGLTGVTALVGPHGLLQQKGALTAQDIKAFGTSDPHVIMQDLLQGYTAPSVSQLRYALHNNLFNRSWAFNTTSAYSPQTNSMASTGATYPNLGRTSSIMSILRPYQQIGPSNQAAQEQIMGMIGPSAAHLLGVQLPQFPNPLTSQGPGGLGGQLGPLGSMTAKQIGGLNAKQTAQDILKVTDALNQVQIAIQNVNQQITKYNDEASRLSIVNEEAAAAVARVQLAMHGMQDTVDQLSLHMQVLQTNIGNPLQHAVAAASQAMANFEQYAILPVQHAQDQWNQTMLLTSNRLEDVSFSMQKAQFNMEKFNGGMLVGENALTAQIEALTIYNEKLQMLSLMNMGLQADLTRTQIHQGFTSTVQPLMGFDLQREMQLGQERQQLAQAQYDTTYGYQHWKLQRAARTQFQKQEMTFAERMSGTKAAASTLSAGTVETMAIQIQQYHEQLQSRKLEQQMYALQLQTWPLQKRAFNANLDLFNFQQKQIYPLSQKIQTDTNTIAKNLLPVQEAAAKVALQTQIWQTGIDRKLLTLNETLGKLQNAVPDLRQLQKDLSTNFDKSIKAGDTPLMNHMQVVAHNTGASAHFLSLIAKAFHIPVATFGGPGGPTSLGGAGGRLAGSPTPVNLSSQGPLKGPGIAGTIKNIIGAILNPLSALSAIGDLASQGWGSITHMPFGTIAGIAGAGFAGLAGANIAGIGMDKLMGKMVLPGIANKLSTSAEGIVGDIRNTVAKVFTKWGDSAAKTSTIGDLFRPMSFAVRKFASIGSYALLQVLGSFIPGGHAVTIPLGFPIAQKAEQRASTWYREQGRGGLTKAAFREFYGGLKSELSRVADGFMGPEGNFLKGIWKAVTLLPHSIGRFITWPVRAIARNLGSVIKDTLGGISKGAGGALDAAAKDTRLFTRDKPGFFAQVSNRLAGLMGSQGAAGGEDLRSLAQDERQLEMFPGVGKTASTGQLELFPASSANADSSALAAEQRTATQTLKEVAGNFWTSVKSFGSHTVDLAKSIGVSAQAAAANVRSATYQYEADKIIRTATKDSEGAAKEMGKAGDEIRRSSGGFISSMRESIKSSSIFQKASELMHGPVAGTFGKVVGFLGDHIRGFGRFIGRFGIGIGLFEALPEKFKGPIGDFVKGVGNFIKDGVSKFAGLIKDNLANIVKDLGDGVRKFASVVANMITKLAEILHIHTSPAVARLASDAAEASRMTMVMERSPTLQRLAQKALAAGQKTIEIGGKVFRIAAGIAGGLSFLPAGVDLIQGKYGQAALQAANAGTYFIPGVGAARIALDVLHMIFGNSVPSSSQALSKFWTRYTQPGATAGNMMTPNPLSGLGLGYPAPTGSSGQTFYPMKLPPGFGVGIDANSLKQAQTIAKQIWRTTLAEQKQFSKLSAADQANAQQAALTGPDGLKNYLDTYQKLTKAGLGTILDTHTFTLGQLSTAYTDYTHLSKSQQKTFWQDYQTDQHGALKALISGPGQLNDYLKAYNTGMAVNLGKQVQGAVDAANNLGSTQNSGYQNIGKITTAWLTALTKTINTWEQSNGLSLTNKHGTPAIGGSLGNVAAAATISVPPAVSIQTIAAPFFAHGGLVEADKHKVGPGRVVRMVEEGHPEVVIPLAPHRRDRARSLMRQTQGLLGGYAAGGYVDPVPGWSASRIDQGVDGTLGAAGYLAPGLSKVIEAISYTSGWKGGWISAQLLDGKYKGHNYFAAEGIAPASGVVPGATIQAGRQLGRVASAAGWGNSPGTIETGWADNAGASTLAQSLPGYAGDQSAAAITAGESFNAFLMSLGAPGGHLDPGAAAPNPKLLQNYPWGKVGAGGTTAVISIPPIHLPGPPDLLRQLGIIGPKQHSILDGHVQNWQKQLNSKASAMGSSATTPGSYNVGPIPAGGYSPTTWAQALLKGLGDKVASQNTADIVRWEQQEGGNWNNAAKYNPLNTTQGMPGSYNPGFSAGVQAYTSWAEGLQATIKTLENGSYSGILAALKGNASLATFEAAVNASPWGTVFANGGFINPLAAFASGGTIGAKLPALPPLPNIPYDIKENLGKLEFGFGGGPQPGQHSKAQHKAAQKKGKSSSSGGTSPASGPAGGGTLVGASEYNDTQAAYSPFTNQTGSIARLQSGGSSWWNQLAEHSKWRVSANNHSFIGTVQDWGTGGGSVAGLPRVVDLWWKDLGLLGLPMDAAANAWGGAVKLEKAAGGIPRVPRDDYLALLHQGETVVQAGTSNMMEQRIHPGSGGAGTGHGHGHHHHRHHGHHHPPTGPVDPNHILHRLDQMHQDMKKVLRTDHGSPLGFDKHQVKEIHHAVVDARKAVEKVRDDIQNHAGPKQIREDMRKAREALEKMHDIQKHDYIQSVFQDINDNTKKLNSQLKASITSDARHFGEKARHEVRHGQSPFGTGSEQTSNTAHELINKLHNIPITHNGQTHYISLQTLLTKAHQEHTDIQTESQTMGTIKAQMAQIKDHTSKKYKHLLHEYTHEAAMRKKSIKQYRAEKRKIHGAELAFMKEEEKAGVPRNLILWAIKNVGMFDNQGLYSDAQLYGIPPALLKQARHYRDPNAKHGHPDSSSLQHHHDAAKHHHHSSKQHHHSSKNYHHHAKQHHAHQKKHYKTTEQSYHATKQYEDSTSKKFDKMINCLGDIHGSLQKIQPNVQNNLLVQVNGFQHHQPKIKVSAPRNR